MLRVWLLGPESSSLFLMPASPPLIPRRQDRLQGRGVTTTRQERAAVSVLRLEARHKGSKVNGKVKVQELKTISVHFRAGR